jgi:hypothetical protein
MLRNLFFELAVVYPAVKIGSEIGTYDNREEINTNGRNGISKYAVFNKTAIVADVQRKR